MPQTLHRGFIPMLCGGFLSAYPISHMCACVRVHVCLHNHAGEWGWVCVCVEGDQRTASSAVALQVPSTCFCCFLLLAETESLRGLERKRRLNWLACEPQRHTCFFYLAHSGSTGTCHDILLFSFSLTWFLGIKLRSPHLQGKPFP